MIDDGELDWKVIAISEDDPKAASVNDIEDVERWAAAQPTPAQCDLPYADCLHIALEVACFWVGQQPALGGVQ